MSRRFGNPIAILQAIVDRLCLQIAQFEPANCYIAINPDELPAPGPGDITCVVSPASGSFLSGYVDGGGTEQLTTPWGVIVKIHSPLQLDEAGRDAVAIQHHSSGLLTLATKVLAALANWDPKDDQNAEQTRDPLLPKGFDFTKSTRKTTAVELSFEVLFDWKLTEE